MARVDGSGSLLQAHDDIVSTTSTWSSEQILNSIITDPGDGDVNGPASSTTNAVARFYDTGGKIIKNSTVIVSDTGHVQASRFVGNEIYPTAGTLTLGATDVLPVSDDTLNLGALATALNTVYTHDIAVESISELVGGDGVLIDGVVLKDAGVQADTITGATGVSTSVNGVSFPGSSAITSTTVNATTATIQNLVISDGTPAYNFPNNRGAYGATLINDGEGNLTWSEIAVIPPPPAEIFPLNDLILDSNLTDVGTNNVIWSAQGMGPLYTATSPHPATSTNSLACASPYTVRGEPSSVIHQGSLTTTFWIRPNVIAACGIYWLESFNPFYEFTMLADGRIRYSDYRVEITSTATVSVGVWAHIAVSYQKGGYHKLYINGHFEDSVADTGATLYGSWYCHIGTSLRNPTNFVGSFAYYRQYRQALTATQINQDKNNVPVMSMSTINAVPRIGEYSHVLQATDATISDAGELSVPILITDTISEQTVDAGVSVDGCLIKDGAAALAGTITLAAGTSATNYIPFGESATGGQALKTNTNLRYDSSTQTLQTPNISGTGGTLLCTASYTDFTGIISCDQINEYSSGVGCTIDQCLIKDGAAAVANALSTGTLTNAMVNAAAGIEDTKLATISTAGKVSNSATTATSANTASAIVARDASGNFSAGTITATSVSATTMDAYFVSSSGAQSIANNTETVVDNYTTASRNVGNITLSSGVFTLNTVGVYSVSIFASFAANTAGFRDLQIVDSSAKIISRSTSSANAVGGTSTIFNASTLIYSGGTETVGFNVRQTSGGALNLSVVEVRIARIS